MRKTFLFFIAIIAVFAVWLFLMHTKSEQLSQSLPAISTNAPISGNTKLNVDVQGTNVKTDISNQSDQTSSAKENLQKSDAGIRNMLEARNHPVELWGKVVDQNGVSLSDVKVETEIGHFEWPPEQYPNGVSTKQEATTDVSGLFHIYDSSAEGVHVILQKDGYKQVRNGYGSGNGGGSKENPVILTLWKLRGAEPLTVSSIDAKIPCDGSSSTFDVATGKESPNGDLRVTLARTPLEVRRSGQGFDWTVKIELLHGGLLAENDPYPYWAPEGGYDPAFEVNMSSNSVSWYSHLTQNFYIKNSSGQYGRMQANVYTALTPARIQFDFTINPSGSQNLEPK